MDNKLFHTFDNIEHTSQYGDIACDLTNNDNKFKMSFAYSDVSFYFENNEAQTIIGLKCGTKIAVNVSKEYIVNDILEEYNEKS